MKTITSNKFLFIDASDNGIRTRSAATLRELISDLITNSGKEIALWSKEESERAIQLWLENEKPE